MTLQSVAVARSVAGLASVIVPLMLKIRVLLTLPLSGTASGTFVLVSVTAA